MKVEGYTAKEIAKILEISYDNARKRISLAGIEPVTKDAIYPLDTPERIRDVKPVGRPKKEPAEPEAKAKPAKSKK